MCGIVGYIGGSPACHILLEGLRRLEYRGYDSAGIAVIHEGQIRIKRVNGKICALEECLKEAPLPGSIGIGHTRWATHGKPSVKNAHPHKAGRVVVVHNGIIENYIELRRWLTSCGCRFLSETDTEVIAQLVNYHLNGNGDGIAAIRKACNTLRGSFAAGILVEDEPTRLYAVRKESPLTVGIGEGEAFLASDVPAILKHTSRIIFMEDGQIGVLDAQGAEFTDFRGQRVRKTIKKISVTPQMAEKGGYKHFMLKEIFEQPRAVTDTLRGRVVPGAGKVILDSLKLSDRTIKGIQRIVVVACGTSYHAGLVARRIIEDWTRIPVEVDIASEFRYREPIITRKTLFIGISQSGETADTLAAVREASKRGAKVISISNVIESSLARMSKHGVIYTQAGPEIGVASTKAFTTQITALYLLALYLAWKRDCMSIGTRQQLIADLMQLPSLMHRTLECSSQIKELAQNFKDYPNFLFLGRGISTAIAYEGALKLKEISYIHAEGYPGGEMKHGPIALISDEMPVVVILSPGKVYEKMLGNVEEVRSRGGIVLAVAAGGAESKIDQTAHGMIRVPASNEYLTSILLTLPLQLLAYYVADLKGTNVDQPRNLAKSVTVE